MEFIYDYILKNYPKKDNRERIIPLTNIIQPVKNWRDIKVSVLQEVYYICKKARVDDRLVRRDEDLSGYQKYDLSKKIRSEAVVELNNMPSISPTNMRGIVHKCLTTKKDKNQEKYYDAGWCKLGWFILGLLYKSRHRDNLVKCFHPTCDSKKAV